MSAQIRVVVVGSRTFKDLARVAAFVSSLPIETVIVSGGATGVDNTAVTTALRRGMPEPRVIRPDYSAFPGKLSKLAPLARNADIAKACDRIAAFWNWASESGGAPNAFIKAMALGRPALLVTEEPAHEQWFRWEVM